MRVAAEVVVVEQRLTRAELTCLNLMASSLKKPASLSSFSFLYRRFLIFCARLGHSAYGSPMSISTQSWSYIKL